MMYAAAEPPYLAPARRARRACAVLDAGARRVPGHVRRRGGDGRARVACGIDPIELRVRNEPDVDPETGNPWSGRHLVDCLRTGAERFGWARPRPTAGRRRDGEWLVGTGVAAATYPGM